MFYSSLGYSKNIFRHLIGLIAAHCFHWSVAWSMLLTCKCHDTLAILLHMDTSEKPHSETVKAFQPFLRSFSKFSCFITRFFIAIFCFFAILRLMETQLVCVCATWESWLHFHPVRESEQTFEFIPTWHMLICIHTSLSNLPGNQLLFEMARRMTSRLFLAQV